MMYGLKIVTAFQNVELSKALADRILAYRERHRVPPWEYSPDEVKVCDLARQCYESGLKIKLIKHIEPNP
jgi:hypothetical protein